MKILSSSAPKSFDFFFFLCSKSWENFVKSKIWEKYEFFIVIKKNWEKFFASLFLIQNRKIVQIFQTGQIVLWDFSISPSNFPTYRKVSIVKLHTRKIWTIPIPNKIFFFCLPHLLVFFFFFFYIWDCLFWPFFFFSSKLSFWIWKRVKQIINHFQKLDYIYQLNTKEIQKEEDDDFFSSKNSRKNQKSKKGTSNLFTEISCKWRSPFFFQKFCPRNLLSCLLIIHTILLIKKYHMNFEKQQNKRE